MNNLENVMTDLLLEKADLHIRLEAKDEALTLVRAALETLVNKLDAVESSEAYQTLFVLGQIHGYRYEGPNWSADLLAARAALRETETR